MNAPKIFSRIVTISLVALFVFSPLCSAETSSDTGDNDKKSSLEDVTRETQDLLKALQSYSVEQRDEAVQKSKEALDDLDQSIEKLENRLADNWDKMDKAARENARATLKALRKKRTQVAEWYGSLKNSSRDAWSQMKKGFSDAYQALQDAWEKSEKEFGTEEETQRENGGTPL